MKLNLITRVLLAAMTLTASTAQASPTEYRFDPFGANGDAGDDLRCAPGTVVTGLKGAVGTNIDRIQVSCSPLQANGQAGPTTSTSAMRGGSGGGAVAANCSRVGSYMTTLGVTLTDDTRQVEAVGGECSGLNDGVPSRVRIAGQHVNTDGFFISDRPVDKTFRSFDCPRGMAATGLIVRYGKHVNGLGLICDFLPKAAPPPAPVGSAVAPARTGRVVNYGKPKATGSQSIMGIWEITTPQGKFNLTLNEIPTPPISPMAQYTGVLKGVDGSTLDGTLTGNGQKSVNNAAKIIEFTFGQPGAKNGGRGTLILNGDGSQLSGTVYDTKGQTTWTGQRK